MTNYIDTLRQVILEPAEFFAKAKKESGFGNALKYYAVSFALYSVLLAVTVFAWTSSPLSQIYTALIASYGLAFIAGYQLVLGASVFVTIFITSVIASAMGARTNFHETFRLLGYVAAAFMPLALVPFVGFLIQLYGLYVVYKGVRVTYGFGAGKTVLFLVAYSLAGAAVGFGLTLFLMPDYWTISIQAQLASQ